MPTPFCGRGCGAPPARDRPRYTITGPDHARAGVYSGRLATILATIHTGGTFMSMRAESLAKKYEGKAADLTLTIEK
ncbi:MAG TPA: hypothetical protein VEL75_17220, partial [Candidatus Methylomirabilis sp.]|nr:hypothetical protein [Candidatus Methylomirabilis sp.]